MLTQLTISNFAIVRHLEIDFQSSMTVITGETGAGKSIVMDALNLCLGERSESHHIRTGMPRVDICARFSLFDTPSARQWLLANQLDDGNECLLRRSMSADGRSRGFINGTAVPLTQLRELGQYLIHIHGQHAWQLLLKQSQQKRLLDSWVAEPQLVESMKQAWHLWHQSCLTKTGHQQQALECDARQQLLQYHLKELNEFSPQIGEYEQMDKEYRWLANRRQLQSVSRQVLQSLFDQEKNSIFSQLYAVKHQLAELVQLDGRLNALVNMLEDASIQISEVSDELRHYNEQLNATPDKFYELEQRISHQLTLARKHRVSPEKLPLLHQQLLDEHQLLLQRENEQQQLEQAIETHYQQAIAIARQLHQLRERHAKELSMRITESMCELAMPYGQFIIEVTFDAEYLSTEGASRVDCYVTTNPGQPLQPLAKVASGGELSRITLAIQVIAARKMETPALIFDEIDAGISGQTAAVVGSLLRQLGASTQVICVTHLPQVAGYAHHHFAVSKHSDGEQTQTQVQQLSKKERLQELARLLGGSEVTKNTLANAKELLTA